MSSFASRLRAALILTLLTVVCLTGCGGREVAKTSVITEPAFELAREYGDDALSVRYEISQTSATVVDRVVARLTASTPDGAPTLFPDPNGSFGEWRLVDFRVRRPSLDDNGLTVSGAAYWLEPFLAGAYTIPPMMVLLEDNATSIVTDAIAVDIVSMFDDDSTTPTLRDIAPLAAIPPSPWRHAMSVLVALIVIALVVLLVDRHRRALALARIPKPAHELALTELERLLAAGLWARGEFDAFYTRLSAVLRVYIERRFGVHAPARTTEEFLGEIATSPDFDRDWPTTLADFLTECDLIKFAGALPDDTMRDSSVSVCRRFIAETRPLATTESVKEEAVE